MPVNTSEPLLGEHEHLATGMRKVFSAPLAVFLAVLLGAFFGLVQYPTHATDEHVSRYYTFYIHIMVMIFVGALSLAPAS